MISIEKLTSEYQVKEIGEEDVPAAYRLFLDNPEYFQYCPPEPSEDTVRGDMRAVPSGKLPFDKHYVGYFDEDRLCAVLDLIERYPDKQTAFIGFFMLRSKLQNKGLGTKLIKEITDYLSSLGYKHIRLGYVLGDKRAEHFWKKNGFEPTGHIAHLELYDIVMAQKEL